MHSVVTSHATYCAIDRFAIAPVTRRDTFALARYVFFLLLLLSTFDPVRVVPAASPPALASMALDNDSATDSWTSGCAMAAGSCDARVAAISTDVSLVLGDNSCGRLVAFARVCAKDTTVDVKERSAKRMSVSIDSTMLVRTCVLRAFVASAVSPVGTGPPLPPLPRWFRRVVRLASAVITALVLLSFRAVCSTSSPSSNGSPSGSIAGDGAAGTDDNAAGEGTVTEMGAASDGVATLVVTGDGVVGTSGAGDGTVPEMDAGDGVVRTNGTGDGTVTAIDAGDGDVEERHLIHTSLMGSGL